MTGVEQRLPPQNLDAEMTVLGSIMLDNEVFASIEGMLTPEHFYKEAHRKVYRAMERLHRQSEPIDLVTLTEELRRTGELEAIGNYAYLLGMMESVPTAAYAESYARIVSEKKVLRDLINASGTVMQMAYDQAQPLDQILDAAETGIFRVSGEQRRHSFHGMTSLVSETFEYINEMHQNPDPVSGLRTGFSDLDNLTAGLQPSSLNVLAARPSMGKTAAALSVGLNAALREGKTVAIFSLEMSAVQLVTRMLCSEARVDMTRVRSGQLSDRDFQRIADAAGRMSESRIYIDDNPSLTVMELRSRARRLMSDHGLGLVIVDYLQLMSGGSTENRQQEISNISRGLKALARELDIPVLVLSQLSRAVESRPNKRPMLSDLRECVTGDTLVNLADGRRLPIADLVGSTPDVLAVDDRGKLVTARSELVWKVGERSVFRVTLASGRVRRTTAGHRWFTFDGWRQLDQLAVGDRVALARTSSDEAPTIPPDAAYSSEAISDDLLAHSESDLYWDRIVAIEPAGAEEVYDLTVPGPASWLADGVVMHNSGAIEQDADLVMFIYRDEYYDPHSEKQGIAEIIIGKQRNGPTGTVELQFHNAYVRFHDLARHG